MRMKRHIKKGKKSGKLNVYKDNVEARNSLKMQAKDIKVGKCVWGYKYELHGAEQ